MLAILLLLAPCVSAAPIDAGSVARCDGIILGAEQVRESIRNREELKVRRAFKCPSCPSCPACPVVKRPPVVSIAIGSALAGLVIGAVVMIAVD